MLTNSRVKFILVVYVGAHCYVVTSLAFFIPCEVGLLDFFLLADLAVLCTHVLISILYPQRL